MKVDNYFFGSDRGCIDNFLPPFKEASIHTPKLSSYYEMEKNNYGFRSDNFSKEDAGSNFLFAGCSQTFGVGLPQNLVWAFQLNKMLNKDKFFNVSTPAASATEICYNVMNYIKKFGKPEAIFLLLPNFERSVSFEKESLKTKVSDNDIKHLSKDEYRSFCAQYYIAISQLETMASLLDIKFLWSTWQFDTERVIAQNNHLFNNFFRVYKYLSFDLDNDLNVDYWQKSEDGIHFSGRESLAVAKAFKKRWEEIQ